MKRQTSTLLLLAVLGGVVLGNSGCLLRGVYAEPDLVEPEVVMAESYPPRWYDGRWVYYRGGGWGYYASNSWYPYAQADPIYVRYHYPRREVSGYAYRPAGNHRGVAVRDRSAYRPQRTTVVHSRRGAYDRATVHTTQRRGERVRSGQGQGQENQGNVRQGNSQSSSQSQSGNKGKRGTRVRNQGRGTPAAGSGDGRR